MTSGLEKVREGPEAGVDIMFLHGLRGNITKTWTKDGVLWPKDLLPRDVERSRIFLFGYDSGITHRDQSLVQKTEIHSDADDLCARLVAERSSTKTEEMPIIFVAHSLGGLVAAQILIHGERREESSNARAITRYLRGMIFLGTPFRGSGSAKPAETIRQVMSFMGIHTQQETLKLLGRDSERLDELTRAFPDVLNKRRTSQNLDDQIQAFFFYETKKTAAGIVNLQPLKRASAAGPPISVVASDGLLVDEQDSRSAVAEKRTPETQHKHDTENGPLEEHVDKKNPSQSNHAEQDQDEDRFGLFLESSYSTSHHIFGGNLDARRQKADVRVLQHIAYIQLVEDRISDLESKVRKICKEPPPTLTDNESALPETISDIRLLAWAEFAPQVEISNKESDRWKHRAELNLDPRNIIEVLQEEPRYDLRFRSKFIPAPTVEPSVEPLSKSNTSETLNTFSVIYPSLIRIRSKTLIQILQDITGCKTKRGPHEHRLLLLQPFKLLVTYAPQLREELRKLDKVHKKDVNPDSRGSRNISQTYKEPPPKREIGPEKLTQTSEARDNLRLLCDLIDHHFKSQVGLAQSLNPEMGKVTFRDLWHIFKPGSEVCTGGSRIQLYRIIKVTGGRDILSFDKPPENQASVKLKDDGYSMGSFILECFYISFDGTRFGPVNVTFQIRKFEGEKDITSFPVFPLTCHPKEFEVREKLLRRGGTFANLSNTKSTAHMKYKGPTLDKKRQEYVDSEVVIDFGLAFMQEGIHRPEISIENLLDDDMHNHMILIPPEVYGFVLRTRRWATFDIDLLEKPDYSNGWNNLVIHKSTKEMVLALVENHERPHGSSTGIDSAMPTVDPVEGKGKGLIILLHGEPGVGKTSTADVFLSKRTSDDIQRNAILSVFLRTLEYYSGILFLTTNRVGKIDRAFKSRIHLSLFYPKLDLGSSLRIWENNLEASKTYLGRQKLKLRYDRDEIMSFAKEHFLVLDRSKKLQTWNGRQIRNAFQTAVAIAKYETKKSEKENPNFQSGIIILSSKQFETVAKIAKNFDNYLSRLHNGKSEADLAKSGQIRVDDYVDESATKKHHRDKESSSRYRSLSPERSRPNKRQRPDKYDSDDGSSQSSDSSESGHQSPRKRKDKKGHTRAK
ncbi:uncharacterized protein N7483_004826 [Penicillium malachiteum]|uniref:uncharacterized protein n=1 Tax=Penicillium malachiteum TaxID=1324776 RepID=UPI002549ADB4|nr:uncharacterized protein N7483_004826 [Penicillium malachiteum]KAJ5730318.1 hypothetical protein N7483_004826 [Penicillium malachiteum]